MIIAVDGPAASGKGTIARALARHYGLPHLDTGLLYQPRGGGDGATDAPRPDARGRCGGGVQLRRQPVGRSHLAR